jgi:hypothetical protein
MPIAGSIGSGNLWLYLIFNDTAVTRVTLDRRAI